MNERQAVLYSSFRVRRSAFYELALADNQPFAREFPVEDFGTLFLIERALDISPATFSAQESDAAAAARAADLRGLGSVL